MERRLRLDPTSGFTITSATAVRARIARLILGEQPHDATLGSVKLHPHQLSAVERLQSAIYEFNGALLSDDVGMGKTYVAIAVARQFDRKLLVAPAALGPMWQDALGKTGVDAEFMTFEALKQRPDVARSNHRRHSISSSSTKPTTSGTRAPIGTLPSSRSCAAPGFCY